MKKLDKQDVATRDRLVEQMDSCYTTVEAAIAEYNTKAAALFGPVEDAIIAYNEAVNNAEGFRDDVVSQIETYMDERSDAWREGERGQAYYEWKESWETPLETIDFDAPDDFEIFIENSADVLRDLESEVAP